MISRRVLAAGWTAMILGLCWMPDRWVTLLARAIGGDSVGGLPLAGVVHVALFFGFGILWRRAGLSPGWTAIGGLAGAMVSEAGQLVPALGRTFAAGDLLCDLAGLALGIGLGHVLPGARDRLVDLPAPSLGDQRPEG